MSRLVKHVSFRLRTHENADTLSEALVEGSGWRCCVRTAEWIQPGEVVTGDPDALPPREGLYFGIDALLDPARPEFAFLANKATRVFPDGRLGHQVKTMRLRGRLSQGLLIRVEPWMRDHTLPTGALDVDAIGAVLGVERYEPPVPVDLRGELVRSPGEFHRYTTLENGKNVPTMFEAGERVEITEKIHGASMRVGLVDEGLDAGSVYCVGSHDRGRQPDGTTIYARMAQKHVSEATLRELASYYPFTQHLILYGEVYGDGLYDLKYGCRANEQRLALYDVRIDHVWQPAVVVETVARALRLETVPRLYAGPYLASLVDGMRGGASVVPGAKHMREGVVVRAVPEARVCIRDATGGDVYEGRKMCKLISDEYLVRRDAKDGH